MGTKKKLVSRTEMSWEVKHAKAAGRGKKEQERGRGARCARVNRENWARTNWDGQH